MPFGSFPGQSEQNHAHGTKPSNRIFTFRLRLSQQSESDLRSDHFSNTLMYAPTCPVHLEFQLFLGLEAPCSSSLAPAPLRSVCCCTWSCSSCSTACSSMDPPLLKTSFLLKSLTPFTPPLPTLLPPCTYVDEMPPSLLSRKCVSVRCSLFWYDTSAAALLLSLWDLPKAVSQQTVGMQARTHRTNRTRRRARTRTVSGSMRGDQ